MAKKKPALPGKPLGEMSVKELEAEMRFREGMRHAFDGSSPKMHANLQREIDLVNSYLSAALNGTTYDPDEE